MGLFKRSEKPVCGVVIAAAGSARRMNGTDKIMASLGGKPVLWHTIAAFNENPLVREIVVVTRREQTETLMALCRQWGFSKVAKVVAGGEDRLHSVENGALALSPRVKLIAVQDGARPLVSQTIITETIRRAEKTGAAAPAVAVKDTVKVARQGFVVSTPERSSLFAIQTPQIFDGDLLKAALKNAIDQNLSVTDDCSCVEQLGMQVALTAGEERNLKITTPMDLSLARLWLKGE